MVLIREAREAQVRQVKACLDRGWTQEQAGEQFGWSVSKTRRIIRADENRKRFEEMGLRVFAV